MTAVREGSRLQKRPRAHLDEGPTIVHGQRLELFRESGSTRDLAPSDELDKNPHHGWPWWAWGLLVVGVGAAGAGGYFAADKAGILGGSASSATVTVTWPK